MSTFDESQSLFNQYHFSVIEVDLPIVTGATNLPTSIVEAAPEWYWELNDVTGIVAVDTMLNGNLEYEVVADTVGYSLPSSTSDGVGTAKDIDGSITRQIYDPVTLTVPSGAPISIDLWTGDGSARDIVLTDAIDLSAGDGFVLIKQRTPAVSTKRDWIIFDTLRLAENYVGMASASNIETNDSNSLTAFNNDGYSLGSLNRLNESGATYAGFTFKKEAGFLDVVLYTGDGIAGRTLAHDLADTVGMVWIKRVQANAEWIVYHRILGTDKYMQLDNASSVLTDTTMWDDTAPTSTELTLGDNSDVNANAIEYIAYIFAHNTDKILCGGYTGNGLDFPNGYVESTGWEPRLAIIKRINASGNWVFFDPVRGIAAGIGNDAVLITRDLNEDSAPRIVFNSTDFELTDNDSDVNSTSGVGGFRDYIYMVMRA